MGCCTNSGFSRYRAFVVPILSCPASIHHRVDKAISPHDVCGGAPLDSLESQANLGEACARLEFASSAPSTKCLY